MAKQVDIGEYIREAERRRLKLDLSRMEAAPGVPVGFRPTQTFNDIVAGIALGRRISANLVLVSGLNGAGKTTALRVYWRGTPGTEYWEARAGYNAKSVLKDILQPLPLTVGEGWRLQTSTAVKYLLENPRVFLIDEAQRLDYHSLDLLKYVADNTGSMFVLSASPSLATRIERWPDISSRCPVRVEVTAMSVSEFVELWQNEGWSLEALEEIHKLSHGVMRTISALFRVLDDYRTAVAEERDTEVPRHAFGADHVRRIATGVVPVETAASELARRS